MPSKFLRLGLRPSVAKNDWDYVRVPVIRIDGQYHVYVAEKQSRIYDDETLPDDMKVKFAMILSVPHTNVIEDENVRGMFDVFINEETKELDEIGWRVSEHLFCIVMPRSTLNSLKGGTQNG